MAKKKQTDSQIIKEMEDRAREGGDLWTSIHTSFRELNRFVNAKDGQFTPEERDKMGDPCVQENRVLSFANFIVNGAVKMDIGCDVEPVSEGADAKLARVRQAQIMKALSMGKFKQAAAMALRHAVCGGFGVLTQKVAFADNSTFNKKIKFEAIKDPTTFICDPSAQEPAMVDMKWARIEQQLSKAGYEKQFGEWKPMNNKEADKWEAGDKKKVFQYWRIIPSGSKLYAAEDGKDYTEEQLETWDDEGGNKPKPSLGDKPTSRPLSSDKVEQIIIANDKVIKVIPHPGCRLPFKVVEGREYFESGRKTLQAMALHAMNPQRKLNFIESQKAAMFSKGPMEVVFLPVEGDTAGIMGKITEAARNGSKNVIGIPYKSSDAQGNQIAPPTFKPQLLGDPTLTVEGEKAVEAIEAVMGIDKGALMSRPKDASGVAIHATEDQAETTNFDYVDNWHTALEELFRDTLYIIPKLGISMQLKLAGDDQKAQTVWVNNEAAAMKSGLQNYDLDEDEEYALTIKVGPSPKSMRDKAFLQMNDYAKRHPQFAPMIADLDARASLDNTYSDDIANRAHSWVAHMAPWVLNQDDDPRSMVLQQQLQQAQGQMQQMAQAMQEIQSKAQQELSAMKSKIDALAADKSNETLRIQLEAEHKARQDEIAAFDKLTNRFKVEQVAAQAVLSPAALLTAKEGDTVTGASTTPAQGGGVANI